MEFKHTPVLFEESINSLNIKSDGTYVDCTLGGGGHASEVCKKLSDQGCFIGIDRDTDAINAAKEKLSIYKCKKLYIHDNYSNIENALNEEKIKGVDGILMDLGVSSFQLDNHERGFSYMQDAPLDMRMNRDDSLTAREVVNLYSEKELTKIIKEFGEEKWASRISQFIVRERKKEPIETTFQLVDIIKAAIPASARRDGPHPAKRTFQAIRIEVNDELGQLAPALSAAIDVLNENGRLCVITFHSLEDRIVKETFRNRADPCICPKELPGCACGRVADIAKITGKPVVCGKEELELNPRARSAKLRVIEKRGN